MKEPKSKLPWKLFNNDEDQCWIESGKKPFEFAVVEMEEAACLEDAEYIVQACNNFPKAIELLKKAEEFMNAVPNKKYGNNYEILFDIGTLLKEIDV